MRGLNLRRMARPARAVPLVAVVVLLAPLSAFASGASATSRHDRGHAGATARPQTAVSPASSSSLPAGSRLTGGESLVSPGGRYHLTMETSGDLVLSWLSQTVWTSKTSGAGAFATQQTDGNFVVYDGAKALWSSRSGGHPSAAYTLSLLSDGDFVITEPDKADLWSSHTETSGVRIQPQATAAFNGDAGDPDVVRSGSTYFAFTTGTPLGNHIQVLVSTAPSSGWHSYTGKTYGSSALPDPPSWEQSNTQTSPGVFEYDHHWVMFYDASLAGHAQGTGYDCISVATATTISATSPVFTDSSHGPLICQASYGGVLDPSPFVNPATNKAYVIWKSNDGSSSQPSHVWSQELDDEGTGVVDAPVEMLTNDTARFSWETTLDDPYMVNANGRDFLMFSSGRYTSSSYVEAFATCSGATGPCSQPAGGPFLATYGHAYGPAGGSLLLDASGNWWIDYAAWNSATCQSYSCGAKRILYVAPIDLGG